MAITVHIIPPHIVERTREWAFDEFNFGEWFPVTDIADFMRREFGYSGDTPQNYALRFVRHGVENKDFETRNTRRKEWRWIVHPQTVTTDATDGA